MELPCGAVCQFYSYDIIGSPLMPPQLLHYSAPILLALAVQGRYILAFCRHAALAARCIDDDGSLKAVTGTARKEFSRHRSQQVIIAMLDNMESK